MYIIAQHEISDPEAFWKTVREGMEEGLPSHLKVHQVFPNREGTKGTCLWEASQVEEVRDFLEAAVGEFSNNTYYTVETNKAIGLPEEALQA